MKKFESRFALREQGLTFGYSDPAPFNGRNLNRQHCSLIMSIQEVLLTLVEQADLVRRGSLLIDGKLNYFRKAVEMPMLNDVVLLARSHFKQQLFSTPAEIDAMEKFCLDGDPAELIVQSCLILEMAMTAGIFDERKLTHEQSRLFEHTHDLEMIAYVHARLSFVKSTSAFHRIIESDMLDAVGRCVDNSEPTWEDMVLLFNAVEPVTAFRLLECLWAKLRNPSFTIPRPAATLLLSLVADAMKHRSSPYSEDIIRRLLDLGASLKISRDCHLPVLNRLMAHLQPQGTGWWMKHLAPSSEEGGRWPTALNRLLANSWSADFVQHLSQFTCCNLDTIEPRTRIFPKKMQSLACLAARHVKAEDLATLPPRIRFDAMKHLPTKPTPRTTFF